MLPKIYNITSRYNQILPLVVKQSIYKLWFFIRENKDKSHVNRKPVFILGNHKAGTTVITVLLGMIANMSVSSGLKKEMISPHVPYVKRGEMSLKSFVNYNRLDFSKEIIKENSLTFLYDDLYHYFNDSKFIFIIRDPRDNIRSILNRLRIPGNLSKINSSDLSCLPPAWRLVIENSWLGTTSTDYIENLAVRWNLATDIYLNNKENIVLLKYEDFLKDKTGTISQLAETIHLPVINDITKFVDIQYQPLGDKNVQWNDFFGMKNLTKIEQICGEKFNTIYK